MINFNEIEQGIEQIFMPSDSGNINKNVQSNPKLYKLIDNEFQKNFIKKLYPNPDWTSRAFWVIATNIEDCSENTKLHEIIRELHKYLITNNLPIPSINWTKWGDTYNELSDMNCITNPYNQRDIMTKIRSAIGNFNGDISQVRQHVIDQGISPDTFTSAITKMKQDGSIFEYETGQYKLI